jgi:ELWxxDGT repeat protein
MGFAMDSAQKCRVRKGYDLHLRLWLRVFGWGSAVLVGIALQPGAVSAVLPELINRADAEAATQPRLVADINPTENTEHNGTTRELTAFGQLVCFSGNDGFHGEELWCSDGTEAGTEMVRDIRVGPGASVPRWLTEVGSTLYFVANDGEHGPELWRSDGTEAGTELVRDIYPDSSPDFFEVNAPHALTNVDGTLFFGANDGEHGGELWRSDGTAAGTMMVKDIYPWETNPWGTKSYVAELTEVDGILFFNAEDGEHGHELWRSDGTEAGTEMIKDIYPGESSRYPGPAGANPVRLINVDGTLFFSAEDGEHGGELWRSDGTEAGTEIVRDISPGPTSSGATEFTNVGGAVMFRVGYEASRVFELWRSDGTEAGTEVFITPGWATATRLTGVGNTLFFTAASSGYRGGLWRSDGTEGGRRWSVVPLA